MNQIIDHNNNSTKNAKYLYLKYKSKYLRLKKIVEIYGGVPLATSPDKKKQQLEEQKNLDEEYEKHKIIHIKNKETAKNYGLKLQDLKQKSRLYSITKELNEGNKIINEKNKQLISATETKIKSKGDHADIENKIKEKIDKMKDDLPQENEQNINNRVKTIIKINGLNNLLKSNIERYIQIKNKNNTIKIDMDGIRDDIESLIKNEHEIIDPSKISSQPGIAGVVPVPIKPDQTTLTDTLNSKKKAYEDKNKDYRDKLSQLNTGINKINELYKTCLNENIELYKLGSNENIDINIKHGELNKINCFNIPDINKDLNKMEEDFIKDKIRLKFEKL